MSLFRTLDRTSAVSNPAHAYPRLAFLYPVLYNKSSRRSLSRKPIDTSSGIPKITTSNKCIDNVFIEALARAGTCPQHAKQVSTLREVNSVTTKHHKTRRKSTLQNSDNKDLKSIKLERRGPIKRVKQFAETELKALVDYYGISLEESPKEEVLEDGSLVWNVGDDHEPWPVSDPKDEVAISKLDELLKIEESPHEEIFATYKLLPVPGVVYLQTTTIRALLHHLAILERATPIAMQRYLAILDDMKNAHIHITRSEWTTAIYLAGRFMGKVSTDELQTALHLWRDMEKRAGVRGGTVTMNVLFDIAVKAGKYTLAESFLKELQARRLKLHRHFRVSLLYYYGVQQHGDAVRKTYEDIVEAGDIVDTVVMNAVIASLIRAGEPAAAEHVFERMKKLHASKTIPFPGKKQFSKRFWRQRRDLGLHLTHEGRQLTRLGDLEERKRLQEYAPIAPDSRTYSLLIRHHARTAGNIDRVVELLREMGYNGVPVEGTIFIVIFHGFHNFGGIRYSFWTPDKLEQTWSEYLSAVQSSLDRTYLSRMAIVSALRAFRKCCGLERMMDAWEEVRKIWDPTPQDSEGVMRVLRQLGPQEGFSEGSM